MQLYKKNLQICYKKDSKNFLEVTKGIEHLQQNALLKFGFSDADSEQI